MLILALDASTSVVTVAVAYVEKHAEAEGGGPWPRPGREVLAEISVPSRGASETLLPAAHNALSLAGTNLSEVGCIIVGIGPGTFTGIRITLATARSLSIATGAALSRNSTLAALAAPALLGAEEPDVLAVLDAKRRQEALLEKSMPIVGDGAVRYREALSGVGRILPEVSPLHRVTAAGHVFSANLAPVPLHEVVPLYVREPDAEVRQDLNPWSKA